MPAVPEYGELDRLPRDMVLPKRRFSAFFKTDLDQTLRTLDVDTVLVGGISTNFCVLTTALDAVCQIARNETEASVRLTAIQALGAQHLGPGALRTLNWCAVNDLSPELRKAAANILAAK